MSTINVTNLSGRGGATPNLPDGANVTGVVTATSFDGSLKTTGTPTLGLGVTINSSGINVSGVLTATTFKGDGSSLTGVGESIAPWYYYPSVGNQSVTVHTGIGITFNKKIDMGSGTATLKIVNAGVAGTTVQSWGVSSVTQASVTEFSLNSIITTLTKDTTYQLDIPEGFVKDGNDTNYVGTAYTFTTKPSQKKLWAWGYNDNYGQLGLGDINYRSSPVQVPGTNWALIEPGYVNNYAIKTDGTLWAWGDNRYGHLGQNNRTYYSSPVQIPGTTWATGENKFATGGSMSIMAIKTNGTLWTSGRNYEGNMGLNLTHNTRYSSPVQIPGTTWSSISPFTYGYQAIKTDGTMWTWGWNHVGQLGLNNQTAYSSPVQVPGTTWRSVSTNGGRYAMAATKTDGTLWTWGINSNGTLGQNNTTPYSSPKQVGSNTTWSSVSSGAYHMVATKTDGTTWTWGKNTEYGALGQNSLTNYSSPIQIPGTWGQMKAAMYFSLGVK